jgi:hypothetical protein
MRRMIKPELLHGERLATREHREVVMRTIGSVAATGMMAFTIACGGNGNSDSNRTAANTAVGDRNGNRTELNGDTRELTGCLLAGGDAGSYVLQLGSGGDATGGSGASATAGSSSTPWVPGATYRVLAQSGQDLSSHLNKMVTINGSVDPGKASTVGTTGNPSSANLPSDSTELATVHADSVRQVADQCPAGASRRPGNQ